MSDNVTDYFLRCPGCHEDSLVWEELEYRCTNCRRMYTEAAMIKALIDSGNLHRCPRCGRMTAWYDDIRDRVSCIHVECQAEMTEEQAAAVDKAAQIIHHFQLPTYGYYSIPLPKGWEPPMDHYDK